ncbi:hypothetical protein GCK72_007401 [Caenorhabditis remanei]|uniref:Uncharacterized protein n=1 Tax=Caenorhabditis remanei TaxID=31234 RepID=A0A6A5HNR8_CAERE|nr:hypothetical protein GCK72_007401 [Caenorhabditis remanei]KAF1767442.1 hypothetical protein GCK72_007401 [Caenorhabditis remanei]
MNTLPLQYQSLKAVFLYMNPNVRFEISHRLPSISSTEKVVPLRIEELDLGDLTTSVNQTSYKLGIFRDYKEGEKITWRAQRYNDFGGLPRDLDRFGFEIFPGHNVLDPGDVSLPCPYSLVRQVERDTVHIERMHKTRLKFYQDVLKTRLGSEDVEISDREGEDAILERYYMSLPINELERHIGEIHEDLQPFECRRFNLKPPFVCYIMLTITSKSHKETSLMPYNMKLHEAMKALNTFLFGGRRQSIQVQKLQFSINGTILRLPVGFKIEAEQLKGVYNLAMRNDAVISMLDKKSFPLKSVSFFAEDKRDFQFFDFGKTTSFTAMDVNPEIDLFSILKTLPNERVNLSFYDPDFGIGEYLGLVQNWIKNERPIGTCYSFGIEEDTARQILKLVKTHVEGAKRSKRCVSIPIRNSARLELYYIPMKCLNDSEQEEFMYDYDWVLKMRIVRF